jgi:hypothetical protein
MAMAFDREIIKTQKGMWTCLFSQVDSFDLTQPCSVLLMFKGFFYFCSFHNKAR